MKMEIQLAAKVVFLDGEAKIETRSYPKCTIDCENIDDLRDRFKQLTKTVFGKLSTIESFPEKKDDLPRGQKTLGE